MPSPQQIDAVEDTLNEPSTVEMSTSGLRLTCFPNPFSETATIAFELDKPTYISLNLYDAYGRKIFAFMESQWLNANKYDFRLEDQTLANGIYSVVLKAGEDTVTKRMIKF